MNLPIKSHPSFRYLFFSDVILVSNYHDCKEEAINLIPHYFIDIIRKTVKPSNLEKLQILENIKKLIIPSHLHIFWLNFDKANHSLLHSFRFGGNRFSKNSTWSFELRTETWVKMHRFNVFSRNVNTINWKIFSTHDGIYKSEKIQQVLWREIKP